MPHFWVYFEHPGQRLPVCIEEACNPMGDTGQGKGDGHRFIHDVPLNPDNKFWDWVEHERAKLQSPKDKALFDRELEESLNQRAQTVADAAAKDSMKTLPPKPQEMQNPDKKRYADLAQEQTKVYQQMKEMITQELLKKGIIHSRAEVEDYRHPQFQANQVYFDVINQKLMDMQMNMIPPWDEQQTEEKNGQVKADRKK